MDLNAAAEISDLRFEDLGLIEYNRAYKIQKDLLQDVMNGGKQKIVLCQHPTVITCGRMTKESNLFCSKEELNKKGIEIINVDRGGDVTLHSQGQLIAYPILNLNNYKRDLRYYLNKLEQVAIDFLSEFGILAVRRKGMTGAWVEDKKIASIGIGVKKWISYHGLSINVNNDLDLFSLINACGLGAAVTSLERIKCSSIDIDNAKRVLISICKKNLLLESNNERSSIAGSW